MGIISKQKGVSNKYFRQKHLLEKYPEKFKVDCEGACAHVGPVRKGCGECLSTNVFCQYVEIANDINVKNICPGTCPYCFSIENSYGKSISPDIIEKGIENFEKEVRRPLSL